jgi:hypothetical protein
MKLKLEIHNMKNNLNVFCLSILMIMSGCYDIFKEKEVRIVGSISVINPRNQEDKGYRMVEYKDDYNENLLNDYIVNVAGDDSILLVKGIEKLNCNETYYLIHHVSGHDPITAQKIDEKDYFHFLNTFKARYHFHTEAPACP